MPKGSEMTLADRKLRTKSKGMDFGGNLNPRRDWTGRTRPGWQRLRSPVVTSEIGDHPQIWGGVEDQFAVPPVQKRMHWRSRRACQFCQGIAAKNFNPGRFLGSHGQARNHRCNEYRPNRRSAP